MSTQLAPIIFGTSALGNLFVAPPFEDKLAIISECVHQAQGPVVFDSAGKYGAGLALETLGKCLHELNVAPEDVIISNKLGWLRTALTTPEPTFEPGVWKDLRFDAVQKISYEGIMECFEQGNQLLGGYIPQLLSVHDPDEYLAQATSPAQDAALYNDILEGYRALHQLKLEGKAQLIGVGAKNWKTIQRIAADVQLDWVMFANSFTILQHPADLVSFITELSQKGVLIVNSAVFHSGFLIGTNFMDYKEIAPDTDEHIALFNWRAAFFSLCDKYAIKPAEACVQFGMSVPGIKCIALNTSSAKRVKSNIEMVNVTIPKAFWDEMKERKLIRADYQFV